MKEYKYDSDKDRIVTKENLKSEPYGPVCVNTKIIFNSSMLDALREALGMKKLSNCKYTIKVANGNEDYLNVHVTSGDVTIDDSYENIEWKSHFTQAEINELKQRDDLAIDWDKAIIKPVD